MLLRESRMPARKPSRTGQIKFSLWAFVLGLAVVIAMVAMNHKTLFKRYELTVDDIRMYWRATSKPLGVVKIAAIDDKSIAELGSGRFAVASWRNSNAS